MAERIKPKIGFVSAGAGSMPHYSSFLPLIPSAIQMDFEGLELYRESLYQIENKKDVIVQRETNSCLPFFDVISRRRREILKCKISHFVRDDK